MNYNSYKQFIWYLGIFNFVQTYQVPVRTKLETGTYGLRSVRPCVPNLYLGHPWTDSFQTLYIPRTLSGTYAHAMISWLDQRWLTGGHLVSRKCSILDMLCQFSFKFSTYIIHVKIQMYMSMTISFTIRSKMATVFGHPLDNTIFLRLTGSVLWHNLVI